MPTLRLVLLTVAILSPPLASASGSLDAGAVVLYEEDAQGWDCTQPVAGFCFFDITGMDGGVGNSTIDARQRLNYVGVATNLSLIRDEAGPLWIVPDENVTFYASRYYASHPVNRLFVGTWQNATGECQPDDAYCLGANSSAVRLSCYCPGTGGGGDITESKNRSYNLTPWNPYCITYEHVGPCNAFPSLSTGHWINANAENMCINDSGRCDTVVRPATQAVERDTPDVIVGLEYYEAQVATDPSNLTMGKTSDEQDPAHAPPGLGRRPAETPPSHAGRRSPSHNASGHQESDQASLSKSATEVPVTRASLARATSLQARPEAAQDLALLTKIAAATAVLGLLLLLAWLRLYSHFSTKKELLVSPVRQQILSIVKHTPGIHLRDLATRLGISRQSAAYHVRLLHRSSLLEVEEDGWKMCIFAAGARPRGSEAPIEQLGFNALCERLHSIIEQGPYGVKKRELHALLRSVSKRRRNRALKRVMASGRIRMVEENGEVWLRPADSTPPVAALLSASPRVGSRSST